MSQFSIKRRAALTSLGLGAAASAISGVVTAQEPPSPFQHGVASGDPLSDRVILWTRITPLPGQTGPISVQWDISDTLNPEAPAASGVATATAAKDFTVKVDATGLKPDTRYIYRFRVGEASSPVGRTLTLPVADVARMTIAVCSCSNYPFGFFNVYREMAENADVDVVLHLGDYIYEYGANDYTPKAIAEAGRTLDPISETVTVEDYRKRYARYRTDPDLQAVHAAHPFLLIWDDHEIANDAWRGGAENHKSDTQGAWEDRRGAAIKAYEEWMPTRADMRRPWRSFDFGNLARIILLDTRLWGRDKQLSYDTDFDPRTIPFDVTDPKDPKPILTPNGRATAAAKKIARLAVPFDFRETPPKPVMDYKSLSSFDPFNAPFYLAYLPDVGGFKERLDNPNRTLLGAEQEAWLGPQLDGSKKRGQTWQILGQQVLMGRIGLPRNLAEMVEGRTGPSADAYRRLARLAPFDLPLTMDGWDGYPAARAKLYDQMRQNARNVIVLSGDTHNAWVSELSDSKGKVGYEFAAPSVSSPGFDRSLPQKAEEMKTGLIDASPTLQWMDAEHRGYMTLSFTPERVETLFHFISSAQSRDYETLPERRFVVRAGDAPDKTKLRETG